MARPLPNDKRALIMATLSRFTRTAAAIGDPARAAMLWGLMDGRALSAGELAGLAGIANSTASEHLATLRDAGLVIRIVNGRHHYHRLASPEVAALLENVLSLTTAAQALVELRTTPVRCGPRDRALRRLRRCYNHLAGEIAVSMTDVMVQRGQLRLNDEAAMITPAGAAFLSKLGLAVPIESSASHVSAPGMLCRPCLDWSERRYHLSGRIGAELYHALGRDHWFRASTQDRALQVTPNGARQLEEHFGIRGAPA
jgi:DNA-binding transcriptional ArsR family regulator